MKSVTTLQRNKISRYRQILCTITRFRKLSHQNDLIDICRTVPGSLQDVQRSGGYCSLIWVIWKCAGYFGVTMGMEFNHFVLE